MKRLLLFGLALMLLLTACTPKEGPIETAEATTAAQTDEATGRPQIDSLYGWHAGYVASASHKTTPCKLVEESDSPYSVTDIITVAKAGTRVTFTDAPSSEGRYNTATGTDILVVSTWIEKSGKWVLDPDGDQLSGSGADVSKSEILTYSAKTKSFTCSFVTTKDNQSIRLCYHSDAEITQYPEVTMEYTGETVTYQKNGDFIRMLWIEEQKASFYDLALQGLTVNAMGDSYFAGEGLDKKDVWIGLLAEKYGMTMNNYGKGGSPVSLFDDKYGSSMMNRYEGMANNNADIILLEGGKNDYNFHTPIGTTDSRDDRTFKGALNVMIDSFKVKYPNAMIVLITVWNFPGGNNLNLDYNDYANAMVDVANAQGIYCLKACDSSISGVNMNDATFRAKYCIKPTDVSHLNADGMKYIFPKMEDKISEFWCDFCAKRESK